MGEVYRARDAKLKREVAIKILPEEFSKDGDRVSRFQREAEVLAALNHQNIAAIYDLQEANATRFLVLELVEGETLAERILRDRIPVEEALHIAHSICEALEAAHEKGIIHRDLKPGNVKITPEGKIKVLDFGLAKALEDPGSSFEDLSNSPTVTMSATRTGVLLGTAAYMSPEQAHGKPADRRSDIFSFGSVLYEMLTGKPAFTGESVGDTLASVLKLDPDCGALPRETPEAIRKLLRRCLTKDRKLRLQAIGEARIVLANPLEEPTSSAAVPKRARVLPWAIAALMTVVAAITFWNSLRPTPIATRSVVRFADPVPVASNGNGLIAFSRDGSKLAFVGGPQRQIYVRMMDQLEARPIPGTDDAVALCFSPDGKWISYVAGRRTPSSALKKLSIGGGPPQTLAPAATQSGPPSQSWSEDETIFFSRPSRFSFNSSNADDCDYPSLLLGPLL
jgi:serine/threonine protein kinase